jgi:hypothetical protein
MVANHKRMHVDLSLADFGGIAGAVALGGALARWCGDWLVTTWQSSKQRGHEKELNELRLAHEAERLGIEAAHQMARQDDALEHERRMLRIKAHAGAAPSAAVEVAHVREYLDFWLTEAHGGDVGYANNITPEPNFDSPREVVAVLIGVANMHPTKAVRAASKELEASVSAFYNEWQHEEAPGKKDMRDWVTAADVILDLIHGSPPGDE